MDLEQDARKAREWGLKAMVVKRLARGARWEPVAELDRLEEAITLAAAIEGFQTAVFIGGYVYWTSDDPHLYNHTVLSHPPTHRVLLDSFPVIHWDLTMRVTTQAKAEKVLRWFAKRVGQEITILRCERHWAHREFFEAEVTTPLGAITVEEAVFRALRTVRLVASGWVISAPDDLGAGMWKFDGWAHKRLNADWPIDTQIPGLLSVSFGLRNYEERECAAPDGI